MRSRRSSATPHRYSRCTCSDCAHRRTWRGGAPSQPAADDPPAVLPDNPVDVRLPPQPWRVVALGRMAQRGTTNPQLDLWESTGRRYGRKRATQLADLDGTVLAVVTDNDGPGSWELVAQARRGTGQHQHRARSPPQVVRPADRPTFRAHGPGDRAAGPGTTGCRARTGVAGGRGVARANCHQVVTSLGTTKLDGPLATLLRYDIEHDTSFVGKRCRRGSTIRVSRSGPRGSCTCTRTPCGTG